MQEGVIQKVTESEESYGIEVPGGGFGLSKQYGAVPKPGDQFKLYTHGTLVRGLDLNGERVFYKDDFHLEAERLLYVAEHKAKQIRDFLKEREKHDRNYETLPEIFRKRVDRFREAGGAEWRWEFEPYEVFCCQQAVALARAMETKERLEAWHQLEPEAQKAQFPDLDDGHSGNTFGTMYRLAYWFLTEQDNVIHEHGALAPLVGCDEYGCRHGEGKDDG